MSNQKIGRRAILRRSLTVLGAAAVAPALLSACGSSGDGDSLSCNSTDGLAPAAAQMRTSQAYTDASPHSDKNCVNCNFFTAGQANTCGSCSVLQGPIHPQGYCNLWAARAS